MNILEDYLEILEEPGYRFEILEGYLVKEDNILEAFMLICWSLPGVRDWLSHPEFPNNANFME